MQRCLTFYSEFLCTILSTRYHEISTKGKHNKITREQQGATTTSILSIAIWDASTRPKDQGKQDKIQVTHHTMPWAPDPMGLRFW